MCHEGCRLCIALRQSQPFHLLAQPFAADAETLGGVGAVALGRTQMELDRTEAIILLTGYVGYCIWIALVSFGVL